MKRRKSAPPSRVSPSTSEQGPSPAARRASGSTGAEGRRPAAVRLQKLLSDAGVASRRRAEELILEGRVLVNDEIVNTLPAFAVPGADRIICNGELVRFEPPRYFMLHKPKGYLCTDSDPGGRPRAVDLLPPGLPKLFPVGRLDMESTGLLLMTNDGELSERVTHPRFGVPKVYRAEVRGKVGGDVTARLLGGVHVAEGRVSASQVRVVHSAHDRSMLEITLREGRDRLVRRMLAQCGHKVRRLTRIRIGPLTLKGLPLGAARRLTPRELADLRAALQRAKPRPRSKSVVQRGERSESSRPGTQPTAEGAPATPSGRRVEQPAESKLRRRTVIS